MYCILRFYDDLNRPFKNISSTKMKLLASLILPTFCQSTWWATLAPNQSWPPLETSIGPAICGNNEKWDICGNTCKERNCQDRVHYEFLGCRMS